VTESRGITRWIAGILDEISSLQNDKGGEILEKCGRECAARGELLKGALETRRRARDKADRDALFQAFKRNIYNTPNLSKEGEVITLVFEHCTCPLVEAGVDNPALCACTVGYTKAVFEALFERTVAVELEQTILRAAPVCVQRIRVIY